MLLATPYLGFEIKGRAPRVISEIRKQEGCASREQIRPRISGELLVLVGAERRWFPRRVVIRGGQLLLGGVQGESCSGIRIPLRHLSLRAGPLPNSLSLIRGSSILLTLQTINERTFDLWVKTIAIELIRQTPLDAVKYLDILNLTESNDRKHKDCNSNYLDEKSTPTPQPLLQEHRVKIDTLPPKSTPPNSVEVLLKKCQSSESYVPVREKLVLFESLCRMGSRVHSTEDVTTQQHRRGAASVVGKRARSMHDLTYCFATGGVREICKYFETKLDDETKQRLINSDSNLNSKTSRFAFGRSAQPNVSYA